MNRRSHNLQRDTAKCVMRSIPRVFRVKAQPTEKTFEEPEGEGDQEGVGDKVDPVGLEEVLPGAIGEVGDVDIGVGARLGEEAGELLEEQKVEQSGSPGSSGKTDAAECEEGNEASAEVGEDRDGRDQARHDHIDQPGRKADDQPEAGQADPGGPPESDPKREAEIREVATPENLLRCPGDPDILDHSGQKEEESEKPKPISLRIGPRGWR
jgi:hypothetical protein